MNQLTKTTGNSEWYTPSRYVEAARVALGGIDLDPASCKTAQRTVKAKRYFSIENSALYQGWEGRVFMNPPYGRDIIDKFVYRLLLYYRPESDSGAWVSAYITLTNDCMDTQWAHDLLRASDAVCFVRGRVKFLTPSGKRPKAPPRGQMFCMGGGDFSAFERCFQPFGIVIDLRRQQETHT